MPVNQSRVFIYPRLFAMHNLPSQCGIVAPEGKALEDGCTTAGDLKICIPPVINLSVERLSSDGIFLLEDTRMMYLWVGRTVNPGLLTSLFGISTMEQVDCASLQLVSPAVDDFGKKVAAIISAIRSDRQSFLKLTIVSEGDLAEARFFWKLVEDRASFNGGSYSYSEYLGHVNRLSHNQAS